MDISWLRYFRGIFLRRYRCIRTITALRWKQNLAIGLNFREWVTIVVFQTKSKLLYYKVYWCIKQTQYSLIIFSGICILKFKLHRMWLITSMSILYPCEFSVYLTFFNLIFLISITIVWMLFCQFFINQGFDIPKEVVDGTIHCKPRAAAKLIDKIYTLLTNRM